MLQMVAPDLSLKRRSIYISAVDSQQQITLFTVSLIVEGDQLDSVQPEDERIGVGRVDACGRWVRAEQLAAGVLDEFLGVAAT